jgi:hypothetical protein
MDREIKNAHNILAKIPEGKISPGRPRHGLEDNTRINL